MELRIEKLLTSSADTTKKKLFVSKPSIFYQFTAITVKDLSSKTQTMVAPIEKVAVFLQRFVATTVDLSKI